MVLQEPLPDPLWVFAYGSLMWKPGFDFAERQRARVSGYHRCFCMRSIHHRGTKEEPGLVLALDPEPQSHCEGVAFRIDPDKATQTVAYLRERELISSAYREAIAEITLPDGSTAPSLAYVMDQSHAQYCGRLSLSEQAEIISRARGGMGHNSDYLFATVDSLQQMGCPDPDLSELAQTVRKLLEI